MTLYCVYILSVPKKKKKKKLITHQQHGILWYAFNGTKSTKNNAVSISVMNEISKSKKPLDHNNTCNKKKNKVGGNQTNFKLRLIIHTSDLVVY